MAKKGDFISLADLSKDELWGYPSTVAIGRSWFPETVW